MKYTIEEFKKLEKVAVMLNKEQWIILKEKNVELTSFIDSMTCLYSNKEGWTRIESNYYRDNNYLIINFEDIMIEKIIGYSCPIDMSSIGISKGELIVLNICGKLYRKNDGKSTFYALPKELVEQWEPVFEKKYKTIQLGTPNRKFRIYKNKIEVVDGVGVLHSFNNSHITSLNNIFILSKNSVNSLPIFIESIHVGCKEGTALIHQDIITIKQIQEAL